MAEWQAFIAGVGFPIAITIYLLVTFNKTISSLKDVIANNTKTINELCIRIEEKEK